MKLFRGVPSPQRSVQELWSPRLELKQQAVAIGLTPRHPNFGFRSFRLCPLIIVRGSEEILELRSDEQWPSASLAIPVC